MLLCCGVGIFSCIFEIYNVVCLCIFLFCYHSFPHLKYGLVSCHDIYLFLPCLDPDESGKVDEDGRFSSNWWKGYSEEVYSFMVLGSSSIVMKVGLPCRFQLALFFKML